MSKLGTAMHRARAELACERCGNRGFVSTADGPDECPECHGDKRNTATIELLELLAIKIEDLEGAARP